MKKSMLLLSALYLAGCASGADDIPAAYVSPIPYQNLTCAQLTTEATAISSRAAAAVGAQNKKSGRDTATVAVGVVLFWPALFFTGGDGVQAAEVSRLKGEMQAIESASRSKGCNIKFAGS